MLNSFGIGQPRINKWEVGEEWFDATSFLVTKMAMWVKCAE